MKWTQNPSANREAVWNLYLMGEGKSIFTNGLTVGMSTTFKDRVYA